MRQIKKKFNYLWNYTRIWLIFWQIHAWKGLMMIPIFGKV